MDTIRFASLIANAASLTRVVLGRLDNADADHSGLVRKHPDDSLVRPFMEMLITAVSPVFTVSDVLKVPHDDRGDTASICIADNRFGETVEQVGALTGTLLVESARLSGYAFCSFRFLLFVVPLKRRQLAARPKGRLAVRTGCGGKMLHSKINGHGFP